MKKTITGLFACLVLVMNLQALAHTLYMTVEDNEDGASNRQGNVFYLGAVGAWVDVRLEDEHGKVLLERKGG